MVCLRFQPNLAIAFTFEATGGRILLAPDTVETRHMSNRDEFTQKTKDAVATRAGWYCSFEGCGRATVGPSDESSEAVTMVGQAAHISGAASGPGADAMMRR